MKLHQSRHIGKAHVIRARGDALHSRARAGAGIERDIQLDIFEVAFGYWAEEQSRWAFKSPVELKFNRRVGLRENSRRLQASHHGSSKSEGTKHGTFVHEKLLI